MGMHVQRSAGLAASDTQAGTTGSTPSQDGVVRKTAANNRAAYNPGGVGNATVPTLATKKSSTPGRNVVGQKGRTVAGTNKTIGGN